MTIYYRYNDRYCDHGHVVLELDEWHPIKETPQGHWCVPKWQFDSAMVRIKDGADLKMIRKLYQVKLFFRNGYSRYAKPSILAAAQHYHLRKAKQVQLLHYQLARAIQAQGAIAHVLADGCYGTNNTAYEIDAGPHDPYGLVKLPDLLPKPRAQSRWAGFTGDRRISEGLF